MPLPRCYNGAAGEVDTIQSPPNWVPCGEDQVLAGETVPCCYLGSYCLSNNLCVVADDSQYQPPEASPYYVAGCTNSTYNNPACSLNCLGNNYNNVKYVGNDQWVCCDDDCSDPAGGAFSAPAPNKLITTVSLGQLNSAFFQYELSSYIDAYDSAPTSIASVLDSVLDEGSILPSRIEQYLTGPASAITYTEVVLTSVPTGGDSKAGPTPPTTPGPNPPRPTGGGNGNSDDDGDSMLGVYVGVPVAVVALIVIAVVGFLVWRRKKKQRRVPEAKTIPDSENSYPPPAMSEVGSNQYSTQNWAGQQYPPPPSEAPASPVPASRSPPMGGSPPLQDYQGFLSPHGEEGGTEVRSELGATEVRSELGSPDPRSPGTAGPPTTDGRAELA